MTHDPAGGHDAPPLRAGAAKVDVTPARGQLPERFLGVLDRIHVRALVLDDGRTRVALVSVDVIGIETGLWREVAGRVEAETGIAAERLLLFASHTHSVPAELGAGFVDAIVAAVRRAVTVLRPATLAVGSGACHVNVNRNLFDPLTHQWREGRNDEGPSDKTVTVLRVDDAAGAPVAVLFHYAVHAVVTGLLDLISADIPGAASRHLEEALGNDAVALWASGCAGDQNPVFYQQTLDLRALRIAEHAARGVDIGNEMPAGGDGLDRDDPVVRRLLDEQAHGVGPRHRARRRGALGRRDRSDAPRARSAWLRSSGWCTPPVDGVRTPAGRDDRARTSRTRRSRCGSGCCGSATSPSVRSTPSCSPRSASGSVGSPPRSTA